MSPLETIRIALESAMGPECAITLDSMAVRMGLKRRIVEQIMEDHISDLPFAVVAGSRGYFRPTDASQINAYLHNLHSRHRRMQLRESTVRRKARRDGWILEGVRFVNSPSQLSLL